MTFKKKPPFKPKKDLNINKEVVEHIKDTKRKMKEKIPQSLPKKKKKDS